MKIFLFQYMRFKLILRIWINSAEPFIVINKSDYNSEPCTLYIIHRLYSTYSEYNASKIVSKIEGRRWKNWKHKIHRSLSENMKSAQRLEKVLKMEYLSDMKNKNIARNQADVYSGNQWFLSILWCIRQNQPLVMLLLSTSFQSHYEMWNRHIHVRQLSLKTEHIW